MPQITPIDIAAFAFCPMLYYENKANVIIPPLTALEENFRQTIIRAERNALLKDSRVTPRKLNTAWDKEWWPTAIQNNISLEKAEKITLKSILKLSDYCKYEFVDDLYPTVGVDIQSQVSIGQSVLIATADILKVNLNISKRNLTIISLNRKELGLTSAARDPAIQALVYAFYSGRQETITHITIDPNQENKKLSIIVSTYQPEDMAEISQMLYHIEHGLRKKVKYFNPWACGVCKVCPNFSL